MKFVFALLIFLAGCFRQSPAPEFEPVAPGAVEFIDVVNLGGAATSEDPVGTSHAYSYPISGLTPEEDERHIAGDAFFERQFVDDFSWLDKELWPVFNNTSCTGCHNRDGRGSLPAGLQESTWTKLTGNDAIFLRISIEGENHDEQWGPVPVPGYSTQLFHSGSLRLREDSPGAGQADVYIRIQKSRFTYPDGRRVELMKPVFKIENAYDLRVMDKDVKLSPRLGPPVFGLGLLDAVEDSEILRLAAIDRSNEGVFGRANLVWDAVKSKAIGMKVKGVGRFGLKASTPSVEQQSMGALNGDIGVTNYLFPIESIFGTKLFEKYIKMGGGGVDRDIEAPDDVAQAIVFYTKTLAVPARRGVKDPQVLRGARLFAEARCTSCHIPSLTTGASALTSLSHQTIYPFTDLLLHDMGEGLADNRKDFLASGRQWKTPPLWGIGLTQTVNPRATFLHDGRARTLEEAILWHDGEGRFSRERFVNFLAADRQALLKFLGSL